MLSRNRVLDSLEHKQPDQIPVDFGGTAVSGMHVTCVAALREYYGLQKEPVKVADPYQMLGMIEPDLEQVLGIDTASVSPKFNMFGNACENWKEWRLHNGLEVLVPGDMNTIVDDNGDILVYPKGDVTVPPSGRMPKEGYYFDAIVRQPLIDEDNLKPEDNLEEFTLLTQEEIDWFSAETKRAASSGRAVVANIGGTAIGDIALVPAVFLKHPKGIRDITEWYMSTALRRDYLHEVFDKQTDIVLRNLDTINKIMGESIDVMYICGTDFGTQIGTFCSADTYTELYMPYYKKMNDWIHTHTKWKTFKHSCGAIAKFIPLFIESGFDILNPVQCSATGMEPEKLKEQYGRDIVFWGGGVDTQMTLPFGTQEEVREQVLRRCDIFSRDSGFVFNATHNVQANTPVENIVAMIEAVRTYNGK